MNNLKKDEETRFSQVMQALVWRYISLKHRQTEMHSITEDHIQEIKSDISSLKYQLWDVLKRNGLEIPSESKKDKGNYVLHSPTYNIETLFMFLT